MLEEQHEYCSIKCVRDASQITSMLYDDTKASHNARPHHPQALPQTPKSNAIISAHSKKFGEFMRCKYEAWLEGNKSEIVGTQIWAQTHVPIWT